jgi:hypothetical protein
MGSGDEEMDLEGVDDMLSGSEGDVRKCNCEQSGHVTVASRTGNLIGYHQSARQRD